MPWKESSRTTVCPHTNPDTPPSSCSRTEEAASWPLACCRARECNPVPSRARSRTERSSRCSSRVRPLSSGSLRRPLPYSPFPPTAPPSSSGRSAPRRTAAASGCQTSPDGHDTAASPLPAPPVCCRQTAAGFCRLCSGPKRADENLKTETCHSMTSVCFHHGCVGVSRACRWPY